MSAPNPIIPGLPIPTSPQGPGPTGFPVGQPGFLGAPPAPQTPVINPELAPADPAALELDPLVMNSKVKIKVFASERMRTRDNLRQSAPFIAQFLMNGPFLQELAQSNMAADFPEFFRLVMDATGLQQDYRLVRAQTPEEAQKRAQPSPDAQLKAQQAQQDAQTRMNLMQTKVKGEQTVAEIMAAVKNKQISEESARHLLALMQKEQADQANAPHPAQKLLDLHTAAQDHAQQMQQTQQKHVLSMQQQAQQHQLGVAHDIQAHNLDLAKSHEQLQSDARSNQMKMVFSAMENAQKLKQQAAMHKAKLAQAAKAKPTPQK